MMLGKNFFLSSFLKYLQVNSMWSEDALPDDVYAVDIYVWTFHRPILLKLLECC
jgi:hypothetical protein